MRDTDNKSRASCRLCPRNCGEGRSRCGTGPEPEVAHVMLHRWEEPCLTGSCLTGREGSGAVFFSGCALGCVYCQNREISRGSGGRVFTAGGLKDIYMELQEKGACNINLVTAGHFLPSVAASIKAAKKEGLIIPVVYNCSGYEKVEALRLLDGLVDIYLPDFKYMDAETAGKYSGASDYPETAMAAVREMVRQCPVQEYDGNGLMKKGVIVGHLLLPGHVRDAKRVVSYLHEEYGDRITLSLLSQYTPMAGVERSFPELGRKVTKREYERLINHALSIGVENAFIQEGDPAEESFIPDFGGSEEENR